MWPFSSILLSKTVRIKILKIQNFKNIRPILYRVIYYKPIKNIISYNRISFHERIFHVKLYSFFLPNIYISLNLHSPN